MATTLINIGGEIREASSLTLPASGRAFRDAWQFNGNVVEVDMVKARDIKIERIVQKAAEKVAKAEQKAMEKALKGLPTTAEDAVVSKFKAKPKAAGIALIRDAATPDDLDKLTEDQIFG